jgi:hypothetical protein
MTLREELIQVAAVAVAIIEDIDYGHCDFYGVGDEYGGTTQTEQVLADIHHERMRQDKKWGPRHYDDKSYWLAILGEEVGEAVDELDDMRRVGDALGIGSVEKARLQVGMNRLSAAGRCLKKSLEHDIFPEPYQKEVL